MKYHVIFKGVRLFSDEPVTLSEATDKVKAITSDILSEIHFMGRTSTLDLTELSIIEAEEDRWKTERPLNSDFTVDEPFDGGGVESEYGSYNSSEIRLGTSSPCYLGVDYAMSKDATSIFCSTPKYEDVSKMAKKLAERLEEDYKYIYKTMDFSTPPIHPDDLKGFPIIEKEGEWSTDGIILQHPDGSSRKIVVDHGDDIVIKNPDISVDAEKECECGKEKHGFMFHSQWCPKHS